MKIPSLLPGYRTLSGADTQILTTIKNHEASTASLVALVREHIDSTTGVSGAQLPPDHPVSERKRQLSIARTEFEAAFMRLCRAAAGPTSPWTANEALPNAQTEREEKGQFLMTVTAKANRREVFTAEEVAKLKALAGWADAPPAPTWDGTLNREEVLRAVTDAYARLDKPAKDARDGA